jgi:hypothetical protein
VLTHLDADAPAMLPFFILIGGHTLLAADLRNSSRRAKPFCKMVFVLVSKKGIANVAFVLGEDAFVAKELRHSVRDPVKTNLRGRSAAEAALPGSTVRLVRNPKSAIRMKRKIRDNIVPTSIISNSFGLLR